MRTIHFLQARQTIESGGVLAYPTEAIIGLGCDPFNEEATRKILAIKHRSIKKGLIVIGSNTQQLLSLIDSGFHQAFTEQANQPFDHPTTWLVPAAKLTPHWLTGVHDSIAVRVCKHKAINDFLLELGSPIVSTSANIANQPPCKTILETRLRFGTVIDGYLPGNTGAWQKPSRIIDLRTFNVQRDL